MTISDSCGGRGCRAGWAVRADRPASDRGAAPPAGRRSRQGAWAWRWCAEGPHQWLSRPTVYTGVRELDEPPDPRGRVRRLDGGPKRLAERQPGLLQALDELADPDTRGDLESPLRLARGVELQSRRDKPARRRE